MRRNRGTRLWLLAAAFALGPAAGAAEESETLTALLQEVRLLREAIERISAFTARSQLVTGQLSVQERRLSRAQTGLEGLERELQAIAAEKPRYQSIQEELERALDEERDPERRQQIEFERTQIQIQIEQARERERELSSRQSRASEAVTIERDRYEELDNRLYQLERELARDGR